MKNFSLSARITLLLGIAAIVLLGGAALIMDQMVDNEVGRRMDNALLTQAQTLASLVNVGTYGLDIEDIRKPRSRLLAGRAVEHWSVHCADGSVATSQPPPSIYPSDWLHTAQSDPTFADVGQKPHVLRAVWFTFQADNGDDVPFRKTADVAVPCSIIFMHSRDVTDDILSDIDDILLLTPLLALIAVLLLSPVLVRHGLKPLNSLGEAMRDIGPQAPGQRLETTGTRELEPLVARFNGVLTRMDEGVARERQFAGALAHETRTHLAELRSLVEVEQRYPSQRPLHALLGEIGTIVVELQDTVSGLLLLTRLEAGIESMDPDNVRIRDVVDRHLESAEASLQQRQLQVNRSTGADHAVLVADRALLDIVVGNLVNNAVAYAPADSTICIRQASHALIIDNAAPDLDASEVARFGQRFWSKHHGTDGHAGLGLALAGAAASAMHLDLRFTLNAQGRLQVTLSWPDELEAA